MSRAWSDPLLPGSAAASAPGETALRIRAELTGALGRTANGGAA